MPSILRNIFFPNPIVVAFAHNHVIEKLKKLFARQYIHSEFISFRAQSQSGPNVFLLQVGIRIDNFKSYLPVPLTCKCKTFETLEGQTQVKLTLIPHPLAIFLFSLCFLAFLVRQFYLAKSGQYGEVIRELMPLFLIILVITFINRIWLYLVRKSLDRYLNQTST